MKQLDLLRGNINPPFTDTELGRCHLRLFLVKELGPEVIVFSKNYKKAPEFASPTNRLVLANTHNGMVRGDDIRSPLVTWAHKGILPMPKGNTFEENSYVFFSLKTQANATKTRLHNWLVFCGIRIHWSAPQMRKANTSFWVLAKVAREQCQISWMAQSILWKIVGIWPIHPKKDMKYSRKKSRKNSNDPCEILEGITNFVGDMKEARGLDIVNRVTHIRRTRAMYAEGMGCPEDAINQLGRWITDMINWNCRENYLKNLPMQALLALAGFALGGEFLCAWGRVLDICNWDEIKKDKDFVDIIEFLVPGLLKLARGAKDAHENSSSITDPNVPISVSNTMFTMGCVAAVCVWIQDAPIMLRRYSKLEKRCPHTYLVHVKISEQWERVRVKVLHEVSLLVAWIHKAT